MWWNDEIADGEGAMSIKAIGGAYKGEVEQDPLFLEAERLGIDIREDEEDRDVSLKSAGDDKSGSGKRMLFNFFDNAGDLDPSPSSHSAEGPLGEPREDGASEREIPMTRSATIAEVASLAKLFCREEKCVYFSGIIYTHAVPADNILGFTSQEVFGIFESGMGWQEGETCRGLQEKEKRGLTYSTYLFTFSSPIYYTDYISTMNARRLASDLKPTLCIEGL